MTTDLGYASPTMLPKPTLRFTVPSLHDGLPLDCRVYHPASLTASPDAPCWQRHAAIVAHPYAPLGGCYDDPVVDIVAGTLLRLGFLVGTFNFRGAHGSAGRTSWTARAERADYISAVGFVSSYVQFLNPFGEASLPRTDSAGSRAEGDEDMTSVVRIRPPTPGLPETTAPHVPILLLAGYSYGAMITSQIPSLESIVALFETPECGSPAAEIRLRAQHLAEMQNTVLASARTAAIDHLRPRSPRKHVGLRVGGDEENRKSHESRRSLSVELEETMRHGVAELLAKARKGHRRSRSSQSLSSRGLDGAAETEHAPDRLLPIPGRLASRPAYLLVSPLQGVITNLATMAVPSTLSSIPGKLWNRSGKASKETSQSELPQPDVLARAVSAEAEDKLVQNSTLAIYGDRDGFVPVRKLRDWASRLQAVEDSRFRAHEVSSANHFWMHHNAAYTLREAVKTFGESLLNSES